MTQEIKPAYVTFEQAKWLKEKGFDEECSHSYKEVEPIVLYQHQDKKYNNSFKKEWQNTVRKNSHMDNAVINRYSAPEQWQVVEWLRVNHGIWVYAERGQNPDSFYPVVDNKERITSFKYHSPMWGNSPQEAYSVAFDYIKDNNLI